jgi:hypothetical protein
VPKAEVNGLFDYLVGAGRKGDWDDEVDGFCGPAGAVWRWIFFAYGKLHVADSQQVAI